MKIEKTNDDCVCPYCKEKHSLDYITDNENIGVSCEDFDYLYLICSEDCPNILLIEGKGYFIIESTIDEEYEYRAHCEACKKEYSGTISL